MKWNRMDWVIFVNDGVTDNFEGKEEPYKGPEKL